MSISEVSIAIYQMATMTAVPEGMAAKSID
jgi:hypothetical protein